MSTEVLKNRLKEINALCTPERAQQKLANEQAVRDQDPFNQERKKLAAQINNIREAIAARDELYAKGDRVGGVKAGTKIRQQLMKEANETAERIEKIHKDRKKRGIGGGGEEKKRADEARQKIVDVMRQHLQELDKAERTIKTTSATNDLEVSDESEQGDGERKVSTLPDLDDPIFDQVNRNEEMINKKLDIVLDKVRVLKQDAVDIGQELDSQSPMIAQLTENVENTFSKLKTVNNQLKETLQEVRSARNFCCDIILCLLILGIAGAVYGLLTKK